VLDLAQLPTPQPFPTAIDRLRRSFARQPDNQTCGAAALRHGLLLGGLTIPAAALEAVLDIRGNGGTPPALLRACLRRLGLEVCPLRKPGRQSTRAFLDGLRPEFAQGAFLLPCIYAGEHWVCLGAWQEGRAGVVDSFFGQQGPCVWPNLAPGLGFFSLTPDDLDALDWAHHLTLARPGRWRAQYEAWLPARPALLRLHQSAALPLTLVQAVRLGVHQYLDDADYAYRGLGLHLPGGLALRVGAEDPGGDAVGVETAGPGGEVVVLRRLGGVLAGRAAPPGLVMRAAALCAAHLEEGSAPQQAAFAAGDVA
jgi:hypothetical protein